MSEMVERVARTIGHAMTDHDGWVKKSYSTDDMAEIARAAIEAMREPFDFMCEAASQFGDEDGYGRIDPHDAEGVWQTMIDAALGKVDA